MKIVFLCGCLEPGRDGVGDYTRQLAAELIKQGHIVSAIALNDKYQKISKEENYSGDSGFKFLRLSSDLPNKERLKYTADWINSFDPEWLSLQFVPYSFNKKGLPFDLGINLKKIGKHRKWHIMFHELYIGTDGKGLKTKIISASQKFIIKQLIVCLKPAITHTHLPFYFNILKNWTKPVFVLPVFSNIPFIESPNHEINYKMTFRIGIFSHISAEEPLLEFLLKLKPLILETETEIEIVLIGGKSGENSSVKQIIETHLNMPGCVINKGFLDAEELSYLLQTCTLGITPLPRHSLGKSGSVAAFLSHGIPVAAPVTLKGFEPDDIGFQSAELRDAILTIPDLNELKRIRQKIDRHKQVISLSEISNDFIETLTSYH
jgi:hypothetical protein